MKSNGTSIDFENNTTSRFVLENGTTSALATSISQTGGIGFDTTLNTPVIKDSIGIKTMATRSWVSSANGYVYAKDYGVTGDDVTDDTTAIQNAITAAQTLGIRTIYMGIGVFKCNIVIPQNIRIVGAGGGFISNFSIPVAPFNTDNYPTVFIPNSTATPVIRVNSVYGVNLEDFAIIGSASQLGEGLSISNNANFPGCDMTVNRISIRGFNKGLSNYGGCDITYNACLFTCSLYNVYQQPAADGAPSDTQVFISCATGGSTSSHCFYFKGCRGTSIIGGDHNLAQHIMYIESGGVVNWVNANSEQTQSWLFELNAGYLNIQAGRFNVVGGIGGNKELLRVTGVTVDYTIGNIVYDGNGSSFLGSSYGTLVKSAGSDYPRTAPNGFLIQRYTSTAFTTLLKTEFTSRLYRNRPTIESTPNVIDDFVNGYTSPFGALGWILTTVGGGGGVGRFPPSGVQNLMGALEIVTSSAGGTDFFKMTTAKELFSANVYPDWENVWEVNFSNTTNSKTRIGLYSNDVNTITGATNATPIVITTSANHNLVNGTNMFIAGVGGNTNANGSYYIKSLSATTYELYTDAGLTIGRAGNGAYTSGGTANAVVPVHGVGIRFTGGTDTNVQFETIVSGVITSTDTGVAISALQSTTNKVGVLLRRMVSTGGTFLGYSCQIANNPETDTTTALGSVYLIPSFFLGSANANFATSRIDRFNLRF
jgi:hypothetical protein